TLPTTLQDASASWVPGQWVGDSLVYFSGPASGESSAITISTGNSLTTSGSFDPAPTPGGTDAFYIASPVSPPQIQSLRFDASLSISSPGAEVTAYAYAENVPASPS